MVANLVAARRWGLANAGMQLPLATSTGYRYLHLTWRRCQGGLDWSVEYGGMAMTRESRTRLHFRLAPVDGWPPVGVETLWCRFTDDGMYQIDNVPFFAKGIAVGDVVSASSDESGLLWFGERISSSGHSTTQLIVLENDARQALVDGLLAAGCAVETGPWPSLLAIDFPDPSAWANGHALLNASVARREIEYEDA